jgi:hypothetical protein
MTRRRHPCGYAADRDLSPSGARGRPPAASTAPAARNQMAPRRIRRRRHPLDGPADLSSPAHGPSTGGAGPLPGRANAQQVVCGARATRTSGCTWTGLRRERVQAWYGKDIRMHMDRPLIQDHSDARRLRSGGAPVRGARRQRRSANPLRPPGDCLARHDVQPAHAAQVALGRPTPFRPHRIGACPPIPVGQGGRRVTGTSSRYTVTTWSGCACAYAATSAISCRLD